MKLSQLTPDQHKAYWWMYNSNVSIEQSEKRLLDAITDYVKSLGGFLYLPNKEHTQTVVLCDEDLNNWHNDRYFEAYIYALKVNDNGELMMFTEEILGSVIVEWSEEEIKFVEDSDQWYELNWDCSNAYLHNLQRIAYYLSSEEIEDED